MIRPMAGENAPFCDPLLRDEKICQAPLGFGMAAMTSSEELGTLPSVGKATVIVVVIPCYRVSQSFFLRLQTL